MAAGRLQIGVPHWPSSNVVTPYSRSSAKCGAEAVYVRAVWNTSVNPCAATTRAQLAQELLESVECEVDPQMQHVWETELASRITKYGRGDALLIPAEEVFAAARRLTQ